MQTGTATITAGDLSPDARRRLAEALHVSLTEADKLVVALCPPEDDAIRRASARKRLLDLLRRLDERTAGIPEAEVEAAVDEAMQFVRPRP